MMDASDITLRHNVSNKHNLLCKKGNYGLKKLGFTTVAGDSISAKESPRMLTVNAFFYCEEKQDSSGPACHWIP